MCVKPPKYFLLLFFYSGITFSSPCRRAICHELPVMSLIGVHARNTFSIISTLLYTSEPPLRNSVCIAHKQTFLMQLCIYLAFRLRPNTTAYPLLKRCRRSERHRVKIPGTVIFPAAASVIADDCCLRRAAYHPFIEYTQHADISGHPGIKQQQTF